MTSVTAPLASRRPPLRVWLLASLPVALVALVFWAWHLPSGGGYTFLAGDWRATALAPGEPPPVGAGVDTSRWQAVRLPGGFGAQGLKGPEIVARRSFTLTGDLKGADLVFVLGYVRDAVVRVWVNGTLVGSKGVYETRFIGSESAMSTSFIPRTLLREGENDIALQVYSNEGERDGITDSRLLLGRQDVLGAWVFHEHTVRNFLELGSLLLLAFLATLVIVLWGLQGDRAPRDLYFSTLGLIASSMLYLLTKSGFLVTAVMSSKAVVGWIATSVHALGLVVPEFVESYYLRRATWFRKVNRVVSGAFLALSLTLGRTATIGGSAALYQIYINWLFIVILSALVLSVRDVVKGATPFGPIVTAAIVLTVGAGINDLLSDLDIIYTPRLFTLALANLGIGSAMVVVGEFLQMGEENRRLSATLATKNEELAEALVRSEESARVKSEFLANTSHELRTPLNSIINIPQGLLEQIHRTRRVRCEGCGSRFELEDGEAYDASAPCPECGKALALEPEAWRLDLDAGEAARLLGSVVASGKHLLAVVNDILDYSKIEAGRMTLHAEPTDADELLDGLRATMEPVAQRAGVRLEVLRLPARHLLECDRVKVMQVLINLVGNAIKFSDGKGTVTVTPSVQGSDGDARLHIAVKDQGIGIAKEHQALIFEGFRQVETGNTRRFGGTGLGLAITRKLVELHGGAIRLDSAPGRGSTFTVELPARVTRREGAAGDTADRVILVVDDEATAVDATAAALRPLDCAIVGVRDPREAMERIRQRRPLLIILDVMMPRVSGLDVLRQLRADPALASIPVVVSSAFPDNRPAVEVLGATFLAKPWRPGELLRVVTEVLAKNPGPLAPSPTHPFPEARSRPT
ncbi:MAG: ATP-binding protein [Myxococcota bacterium]